MSTQDPGGARWPRSLKGQVLLALALALLLAQAIGATLQWRVQVESRREAQVHMLGFRIINAWRRAGPNAAVPLPADRPATQDPGAGWFRAQRPVAAAAFVPLPGDERSARAEAELRTIFAEQEVPLSEVIVVRRGLAADPELRALLAARADDQVQTGDRRPLPADMLVAAVRRHAGGQWTLARAFSLPGEPHMLAVLVVQTVLLYALLVGAMALVIRRITRPLAALTQRIERFSRGPEAVGRDPQGQLEPTGPDDLRRLIAAHNAMEARIVALLDEKDVMLGAIGHDLKTPLAALRVRIECVDDQHERERMAATIDDLARSLDDMLSLARVGRPADPLESTELSALVASVVEEFEDMGLPVELAGTSRVALPLRATWLRRGVRNLIANAVRYGTVARVALGIEEHGGRRWAVVRIDDDGPGIAEGEIARMLEPFTRGEPSRNSVTGGAGLGLTLARAIAEQHGGALRLANRRDGTGAIAGLSATLSLPFA